MDINQTCLRFNLLASVIIATTALCGMEFSSRAAETNAPRPNIVLILADDMGYSDLGCFGSEISTPNLDRLAADGMRMSEFHNTPRCCPSRAALLTGLYPQEAGIGDMMQARDLPGYRGELNHDCPTIAEVLRAAGYDTAMVGKWHISHIFFDGKKQLNGESEKPFWDTKADWPMQRGFEQYFGTIHGVTSYYHPFSLVDGNTPIYSVPTNFYYTDVISDHAVADIDDYAGEQKPFFLFVSYTAAHWPLQAPEADIAKYRARYLAGWDVIRTNRYEKQIALGLIDKSWPLSPRDPRVPPWNEVKDKKWEANRMATYAAMIEHLDRGVGRIREELKQKGIEKNTLVLFFSDNGACAEVIQPEWYDVPSKLRDGRTVKIGNGDHSVFAGPEDVWQSYGVPWANVSDTPFLLYKHFTHEGGISSPFIAYWPDVIKNHDSISSQVGHITDIMATALDVAGAKYPATFNGKSTPSLEGESLLPIFEGQKRPHPKPIFWEHEGNRAVWLGDWKLVARNRHPWELYNVKADRTEQNNLAASQPKRVTEMSALYDAWAKRCNVVPYDQLPHVLHTVPASND
jgi:arylsulfatase